MKKMFFVFVLVASILQVNTAQPQSKAIDSLKQVIIGYPKEDNNLVNNLFQLGELYLSIDLDTNLFYVIKALEISKKIQFKKGIIRGNQRIGRTFLLQSKYLLAEKYTKIAINKALLFADSSMLAPCYQNISSINYRLGRSDSVFYYSTKFNNLPDNYKTPILEFYNYVNLFDLYASAGLYDKAYAYFITMKEHATEHNILEQVIMGLNIRMAFMLLNNQEYSESEKYCLEAKRYEDVNNLYETLSNNINLIVVYWRLKRFKEAEDLAKFTLISAEKTRIGNVIIAALVNLSGMYIENGDLQSSDFYLGMLEKYLSDDYLESYAYYCGLICLTNIAKGNNQKALEYMKKAEGYLAKAENPVVRIEIYKSAKDEFKKRGDFENALKYFELETVYKDSLKTEQNKTSLSLMQIDFEVDKKDREIETLKLKSKLQQTTIQRNRLIALLITSGLLLGLIISGFIIFYLNRKKKTSEILIRKNEEISNQKYQTFYKESQIVAIREKIAGQEEERSRIARELHDGIGGTLAAVKMRLEEVNHQPNPEDMASLVNMVANTWEELRTISHNLMPPQFEEVSVDRVLQNHVRELNKSSKTDFTIQFIPKIGWEKIPAELQVELYRVVQELCTNIIKYSNATTVEIQLSQLEGNINLTMEDNGAPFSYSSKGIGYRNLQERIKLLHGSFEKNEENNKGNTYLIEIPLIEVMHNYQKI